MSERALCIDSDAAVTLLALGVLDEALGCIGFHRRECRRLRSLRAQIERSKWLRDDWPVFDRAASLNILAEIPVLADVPSSELLGALNINGIHEGEAYFLATLIKNPGYILLSGDRVMLGALHGSRTPEIEYVRNAVRGRVILLPQLMGALAGKLSVEDLKKRIRASLCRHTGLRVMLGGGGSFWDAYNAELKMMREICGDDWLFPLRVELPPSSGSLPGDR